jgi:hypothetical protein
VTALALDPQRPDEVYAAVERREPVVASGTVRSYRTTSTVVRASRDRGETWSELGDATLPPVRDLAVGVDGRSLFAATSTGVYRVALGR